MTVPDTVSSDYTLRPSEIVATFALLVEARQPCNLWGVPTAPNARSRKQVAACQ